MTEQEITEHLKALPYEVPADLPTSGVDVLMTAVDFKGMTEEQFWEHLAQLSPKEQQEFFESARQTREQLGKLGIWIIISVPIMILSWLLF